MTENAIGRYARRKTAGSTDHKVESQTERGCFTNCGRYMAWKDKGGRPLIVSDSATSLCRQCA